RYDFDRYSGYNDNTKNVNLNNANNPNGFDFNTTTADESMVVSTGPYYYWKYNLNRASVSAAANLKITDQMATYFRYSNGFRSPDEATLHDNAQIVNTLKPVTLNQYELGYKYEEKVFDVFANFFYSKINNVNFSDLLTDGSSVNKFADSRTYGLELEGDIHAGGFGLSLSGTFQNPSYTKFSGDGGGTPYDYKDNEVERIPKIFGTLRPSYTYKGFSVYVEGDYFGKKFADNANLITLPSFATLNAGVSYTIKNVRFAIDGSNLTNTVGLTEGNPRLGDGTTVGDVYYARPIQGAFGQFSVMINF
ncbi:MAG TPA: TonB-dependent receptor, partial [Arachidicoccus sp.]